MKTKIILFVFLMGFSFMGKSQTLVEFENKIEFDINDEFQSYLPQVNLLSEFKITDNLDGYGFALVNSRWANAYGGLSFDVTEWFKCQVGLGVEVKTPEMTIYSNLYPIRFNSNLIFNFGGIFNSLQIYEFGGSGFYYNLINTVRLSDKFSTGFIVKRYSGIGPLISYSIKSSLVTLLVCPFYDSEFKCYNVMGTLQFYFDK